MRSLLTGGIIAFFALGAPGSLGGCSDPALMLFESDSHRIETDLLPVIDEDWTLRTGKFRLVVKDPVAFTQVFSQWEVRVFAMPQEGDLVFDADRDRTLYTLTHPIDENVADSYDLGTLLATTGREEYVVWQLTLTRHEGEPSRSSRSIGWGKARS